MVLLNTNMISEVIKSRINSNIPTYRKNGADTEVPIIFPNVVEGSPIPRIEMQLVSRKQEGNTLKGNERLEERGAYGFLIVVPTDEGEMLINSIIDQLRDAFPEGLALDVNDAGDNKVGVVQIIQAPSAGVPEYKDVADYRCFVNINYVATSI